MVSSSYGHSSEPTIFKFRNFSQFKFAPALQLRLELEGPARARDSLLQVVVELVFFRKVSQGGSLLMFSINSDHSNQLVY